MEFYFQSNSGKNCLKCPKSNSLSLCLTELFSIEINIGPTDGVMIVPSTHHPNVLYYRSSDLLSRITESLYKPNSPGNPFTFIPRNLEKEPVTKD